MSYRFHRVPRGNPPPPTRGGGHFLTYGTYANPGIFLELPSGEAYCDQIDAGGIARVGFPGIIAGVSFAFGSGAALVVSTTPLLRYFGETGQESQESTEATSAAAFAEDC